MAVVFIHHLLFFSTQHPHSYTVSPGSEERMGAEMTCIINYYSLKTKKEYLLFLQKGKQSIVIYSCIYTRKQTKKPRWQSGLNKCIHSELYSGFIRDGG